VASLLPSARLSKPTRVSGSGGAARCHLTTAMPRIVAQGHVKYALMDLTALDRQEYYNGFANRALWPTMHYRIGLSDFSRADYAGYLRVIPERMEAFERFLVSNPDRRGRVTYLQIVPKSRSDVPEYATLSRVVNETLGRINGSLGEPGWGAPTACVCGVGLRAVSYVDAPVGQGFC
jgi:trehalose-6-phosphate synthase